MGDAKRPKSAARPFGGVVFPDPVRPGAIARRGGHFPPPPPPSPETVTATFAELKGEWKTLAAEYAAGRASNDATQAGNLAWLVEAMAGRAFPAPPVDPGRLATLFAAMWGGIDISEGRAWAADARRGPVVEALLTLLSPAVVLEALLESHAIEPRQQDGKRWIATKATPVVLGAGRTVPQGELAAWRALRHGLARASSEEHAAGEAVGQRHWGRASITVRVALAFAFPGRAEWTREIVTEVSAKTVWDDGTKKSAESRALSYGGTALLASVTTKEDAMLLIEKPHAREYLDALLDGLGAEALEPLFVCFKNSFGWRPRVNAEMFNDMLARPGDLLLSIESPETARLLRETQREWASTKFGKRALAFLSRSDGPAEPAPPRARAIIEPIALRAAPPVPSSLTRLATLAPPPRCPLHAKGDWAAVENKLGLSVPADFRALTETYGSGSFDELLWLWNPFDPGPLNLFDQMARAASFHDKLKKESPDFAAALFPYPPRPKPGSVVPFATDDEGRPFYWVTKGTPDKWVVVRTGRIPGQGHTFDVGIGKLLERWLTGRVELFGTADEKHYFLPEPGTPRPRLEAVLSPSEMPFKKRVRAMRTTLEAIAGPSHTVGEGEQESNGEDHFATAAHWLVGYSEAEGGGPKLTLDVPAEHEAMMRPAIEAVAQATQATVLAVTPVKRSRWA